MPISGRFVLKYTGLLLAIGFLTLLGIVGMTIWLGERAQTYANDAIQARDTRVSAVELHSAVQSAESAQREGAAVAASRRRLPIRRDRREGRSRERSLADPPQRLARTAAEVIHIHMDAFYASLEAQLGS